MIKIWQIHNFIDQNTNWKFSKKKEITDYENKKYIIRKLI